jgi:RHS repeat-associated protein
VTSTPEATWTNPSPTPVTNKTTYLAGFQYKDNRLEFFPHAEGYVKYQYNENSYSYVFNYTDHIGNVRVSYSDIDKNGILGNEHIQECPKQIGSTPPPCQDLYVSAILEESHYYPFGLKHEGYNSNNQQPNYNYKYNGKELQTELGLNMYDMDMRDYDPAIARWVVQDPIIHYSMSPYTAFDNNPVFFADPSGADAEGFENADGLTHEQWMNTTRPSRGGNDQASNYRRENLADYLFSNMEIETKRQVGNFDCVPTCAIVASKILNFEILPYMLSSTKQYATKHKGIPTHLNIRALTDLGFDVVAFGGNDPEKHVFNEGIPDISYAKAVQFIVESLKNGYPVMLAYKTPEMESNQAHASLVKEIYYLPDYTHFKQMKLMDPAINERIINTLRNKYDRNETVYSIFSLRKTKQTNETN